MSVAIDVFPEKLASDKLDVRCVSKAGSNKLEIEGVTFHALTDAQYQQIVDAIETYLLRKQLRDRERAAAPVTAAPEGGTDAKV